MRREGCVLIIFIFSFVVGRGLDLYIGRVGKKALDVEFDLFCQQKQPNSHAMSLSGCETI